MRSRDNIYMHARQNGDVQTTRLHYIDSERICRTGRKRGGNMAATFHFE
jgi:hypothetical protein